MDLWINDFTPITIMHPIKPSLDGKNLSGLKDAAGKYLFLEMVRVCKAKGAGFVNYMWPSRAAISPWPRFPM